MTDLDARAEELENDRTHGGSWLARRAVEGLIAVIEEPADSTDEFLERLVAAARRLAAARPAMGAITHAVGRLAASASTASHLPPDELRRLVAEEANALIAGRDRAGASIAVHLRPQLEDATVLTHSASATVREAVVHGAPARVLCTVSAPVEEGLTFAAELKGEGVPAEIVEERDLDGSLGVASIVLVGADTVYQDGSLKNKIGTRPLAEKAASAGVRVVVACELLKLAPIDPPAEEDEPDLRDTTPPGFIDQIVTEEGFVEPEDIRVVIDRTPFLRDGYRLVGGG